MARSPARGGPRTGRPTRAGEGEYGCRAGPLDDIAWYCGNSHERIHDVGGERPDASGPYDMLGNVWEWCDVYDAEVWGSYRVLRAYLLTFDR